MNFINYTTFFAVGMRYTFELNRREASRSRGCVYRQRIVDISESNLSDFIRAVQENEALHSFVLRTCKVEWMGQVGGLTLYSASRNPELARAYYGVVDTLGTDLNLSSFLNFIEELRITVANDLPE